MKKLLPLLLLLPLSINAQEVQPAPSISEPLKWEIGANTSMAFDPEMNFAFYDDVFLMGRTSISAYRNFKTSQLGLVVEGGVSGIGFGWHVSAQAVANRTVQFRKFYLYGGGAAGYVREKANYFRDNGRNDLMNGFVMGLQGGIVYNLGKRFGVNFEVAARSKQQWMNVTNYIYNNPPHGVTPQLLYTYDEVVSDFDVYFPLSVGVRYRF